MCFLKSFGELFQEYCEDQELLSQLGTGVVQAMRLDSQNRTIELDVAFDCPVKRCVLFAAEKMLEASSLKVTRAVIFPHFPPETFCEEYYPELAEELRRRIASLNGTIKDSTAKLQGNRLTVILTHGGAEILRGKRFDHELSQLIYSEFGTSFQVEFGGVTSIAEDDVAYQEKKALEREKRERKKLVEEMDAYENKNFDGKKKDNSITSIRKENTLYPQPVLSSAKVIFGKPIKGKPMPIAQVTHDAGKVTIWGEVVSVEQKERQDGLKKIYLINVTDYTGSHTLKIMEFKESCKTLDGISKGMCLLIRGEVSYDKYNREVVVNVESLSKVEKIKVIDDAPVKRVELHLHTNMSAMDGITPAADLINRAYSWGHKAVAVTDHGVAQAFPDAMNAVKKIRKKRRRVQSDLRNRGLLCERYGTAGRCGQPDALFRRFCGFRSGNDGLKCWQRPDYGNWRSAYPKRGDRRGIQHLCKPGEADSFENHGAHRYQRQHGDRCSKGKRGGRGLFTVLR